MTTAKQMFEAGRAYQVQHSQHMMKRPAGHPRGDWLAQGGPDSPAWISKHAQCRFDSGHPLTKDLWVWSNDGATVLARIDLTASDAADKLAAFGTDWQPET